MQTMLDERRRRAAYRATHRGTKEMDWLLGKYANANLAGMPDAEFDVFERLIQEPDPNLQQQIMLGTRSAASEFAVHIQRIRAFHGIAEGTPKAMG